MRKTPIDIAQVHRITQQAMLRSATAEVVRDAALINMGFRFMMRNGELDVAQDDVTIEGNNVGVIFRSEKARGGRHRPVQPRPRTRWVYARDLADVLRKYISIKDGASTGTTSNAATTGHQQRRPLFPTKTSPTRALSASNVRRILYLRLGQPPAEHGTTTSMPWSLRAGGATYLMRQGTTPEEVRRLGRWVSETSLQYSIMNKDAQLRIWKKIRAKDGSKTTRKE